MHNISKNHAKSSISYSLDINILNFSMYQYFASSIRDKFRQVVESILASPNSIFPWQDNSIPLRCLFKCASTKKVFSLWKTLVGFIIASSLEMWFQIWSLRIVLIEAQSLKFSSLIFNFGVQVRNFEAILPDINNL